LVATLPMYGVRSHEFFVLAAAIVMMLPGLMIFWRLSARFRSLCYQIRDPTFEHDLPLVLVLVVLEDLTQPGGGDIKFRWLQPPQTN
jgi:hypothetical protein